MPALKSKKLGPSEASNGNIVVSSQQSRFHEVENPTSKDIDVKDLTISVGGREILEHCQLSIKEGHRYAFTGRNGLGKSTVLRAFAERRIPGVPLNLRILLLGQTRVDTDDVEASNTRDASETVIQNVVRSDKRRERLLKDAELLSYALESRGGSSDLIVQATRKLQKEEAERSLEDAKLVAERRSGARGSKARQVLIEKERALDEANAQQTAPPPEDVEAEIQSAIARLEKLQLGLESMDSSTVDARARSILIGLGFSTSQIESPLTNLSGGWRTRASLAAALVQQSDVLLLDEPTNFLDLPAVIWLQHYLTTSLSPNTTLVVTTHDRDFADATATHLIILRMNPPKSIETFSGTLTDYFAEKRRQIRRMTKMSDALDKKKAHMESTISKSLTAAKRAGDDKKLKQAASRKKKLEERTGLEINAQGHRFKLNRDRAGWQDSARAGIDIPEFDPPVTIKLPEQPTTLRNPGSLVSLENVSFTYPKAKVQTLDSITLTVQPGARLGLVGLNGSGKSTLVNLIRQAYNSINPAAEVDPSLPKIKVTKGSLSIHPQVRISHYSQHSTEVLTAFGLQNPTMTALSYLQSLYPEATEQTLRALLSGFALHPTHQASTPMAQLSGGQLSRLALSLLFLPSAPQLLIMDEPTTHLDHATILALIVALRQYQGGLLAISHDRFFMRCVIENQSPYTYIGDVDGNESGLESSDEDEDVTAYDTSRQPGKIYRLTKTGKMFYLERGMDQYEEIVVKNLAKNGIHV